MRKFESIRLRILIAIGIGIFLTTIIGILISSSVVSHFDVDHLEKQMDLSQAMYRQFLADDAETLSGVITMLRKDRYLQDLFLAGDRVGLLAQSENIFTKLRDAYRITHFYYHNSNGQNFLRVHTPGRYGDQINRITMRQAMSTRKLASGIELGPLGTFTLRVVVPWSRDGEIIGYLELGEEIEHITEKIAKLLGVDLVLVIHKEFASKDGWLQGQRLMGRSGNWEFLKKHALLNTSFAKLPTAVIAYLRNVIDPENNSGNNQQVSTDILASSRPLKDASGRDLGNFIVFVDTSDSVGDLREASFDYVQYSLLLFTFLLVGYWAYLGGIEKSIKTGRKELSQALTEQKADRMKLEKILTTMAEGFLLTMPSWRKITQVNKKMAEMVGLPAEKILNRSITDFIHPDAMPVVQEMIAQLNQGNQARGELVLMHNGDQMPCLVTASPMLDEKGTVIGSFSTWNDISDYKKTMERLLEIERNFNQVFFNTTDAIAIIKREKFVSCNEPFVKMLGADEKTEVLNIHPSSLSPDKQPDGQFSHIKAEAMIARAVEERFHRFEWQHRKMNGDIFPVEVSLTALRNRGEIELHCLLKDLSDQKEYEHNLQQAAADAIAASRSKDEFLANMSHEIRTPMNGIIGFTRLTLETELTAKQRQMLANALYSAENLLGLLNDILDFSKIEAGQLSLEKHDFSLEAMVDHLISTLSFQAREKQLYLRDISDYSALPRFIKADELRLRQIIINLVGNSIKFTNEGGVTIQVKVDKRQENDYILHFTVKDTGIGIPADQQHLIFQSFTQGDASVARKFGGTGLGLSISKHLVELMDGRIWLESTVNEGSSFHFLVRVANGRAVEDKAGQLEAMPFRRKLRILLVEDNKFNQDVAVAVFSKDGHQVTVAEHGLMALEALLAEDFDVVFMDVQMPVLDGLTTAAIIRSCEAKKATGKAEVADLEEKLMRKMAGGHIPIVAMTANAMSGDRRKCIDGGMDEYLTKPFMPKHVHGVLLMLFPTDDEKQSNDLEIEAEFSSTTEQTNDSLLEQVKKHLKTVYGLDNSVAEQMLQRAASSLAEARDTMSEALAAGEHVVLKKAAHYLKGALLNMGLDMLAEQAKAIEQAATAEVMLSEEKYTDFQAVLWRLIKEIENKP